MSLGTSIQVTHKFVSGKADGADGTLVQPSKWNQAENFGAGSDGQVPIRDSSATEGASWVDAGSAYQVRGLVGANNGATPNTKYDLSADLAVLRHPTLAYGVAFKNTGTITNDTGLAGPAANGRDQAGAFASSTWLHFYFIWGNGQALATLSSVVAPPTGPTLPANYTHWAYAGAVFYNATPLLVKTRMRGSVMSYETAQTALNAGTATVETAVSVSALVPPNALAFDSFIRQDAMTTGGGLLVVTTNLRVVSGSDFFAPTMSIQGPASLFQQASSACPRMPNIGQQFLYLQTVTSGSAPHLSVLITAYQVPNGGE